MELKVHTGKLADEPLPVGKVKVFRPGDVVRLKSGGPKMTICQSYAEGVRVRWFDQHGMNETVIAVPALSKVRK